jgi:hypothetical protein
VVDVIGRVQIALSTTLFVVASSVTAGCWLTTSFDALDPPPGAAGDSADATDARESAPLVEAGSSAPTCATALLCDDFDQGLDARWSKDVAGGGSITADATRAHRGAGALHVHAGGSGPAAGSAAVKAAMELPRPFHVRVFAYVPSSPIASEPDPTPNTFLMLTKPAPAYDTMQLRIEGAPGAKRYGFADDTSSTFVTSTDAFPLDAWTCVTRGRASSGRSATTAPRPGRMQRRSISSR